MVLIFAKSPMSLKKILLFTTFSKVIEAASRTAFKFSITNFASSSTPVVINSLVAGLMAICPDIYKVSPANTAWLYGPSGAGALTVLMIFFMIVYVLYFNFLYYRHIS